MPFDIEFLDHVAIRVKDMEASAAWYEKVLGMKRIQPEEWKPFPIMMMSGSVGVALFPANLIDPLENGRNVKIDHFAFRVSPENFRKARKHYDELGVEYVFQDHFYFHSIYANDPDGHKVELTTLVDEKLFPK